MPGLEEIKKVGGMIRLRDILQNPYTSHGMSHTARLSMNPLHRGTHKTEPRVSHHIEG